MRKAKYNLFTLKRQLEIKTDKVYTWKQIADYLGVHRNTMQNFANNKLDRVDLDLLMKLLDFFESEGLPIELSDLIVISNVPEQTPSLTVTNSDNVSNS